MKDPVRLLRLVGLMEAVSFLLLLGVAMPLKYFAGLPLAVKIAGAVHGGLFVLLSVLVLRTMWVAKWGLGRGLLVWIAALVPFGPFLLERRLRVYSMEFRERQRGSKLEVVSAVSSVSSTQTVDLAATSE